MKPEFDADINIFCDVCKKKKQYVVRIYEDKFRNLPEYKICHECINEAIFKLSKIMKPQGFKEE